MPEPRQFRIDPGKTTRVALSEGNFYNSESVVLKDEYQQLYGNGEELEGFEVETPTVIRFDEKSGKDKAGFVFVLGQSADDGHNILCSHCSRILAMNILNGQVVRVVFVCPDCGQENPVHPRLP